MADEINNNQQSTIVIDTDHVDYNHTKAYQPNQTERYDEVGSHSYLYKFDNNPDTFEDGTKVIPTMEAMNVYSAYVKDYIDHKDNVLGVNLASQGETLAAIDQKVLDLSTKVLSKVESIQSYLANKSVLVMTEEFARVFKNLDNYNDVAVPIIPEFFEAYKDHSEDCFYSITNYKVSVQNNEDALDISCDANELNKIKDNNNNSKYNSDYGNTDAAKTHFKLYLQHCFNNSGSAPISYDSEKNIYNNLSEIENNDTTVWGKKNRCNSLPIYTNNNDYACDEYAEFATVRHFLEFYPFPYRCLLPKDIFSWVSGAYDQAPVLYDPYNNRIYEYGAKYASQIKFMHHSIRVKFPNEDYRTGIGYGNARKKSMFFSNLRDEDYINNGDLFTAFGTNDWTKINGNFDTNPKNRFNNMFTAQAKALYKIQTGNVYEGELNETSADILDVLNTNGVLSDNSLIIGDGPFYETDFHGAACIDNSITDIDKYTTYIPEQYQEKYPWGAIIMHYHVAAEAPSTVVWQFIGNDKFDKDQNLIEDVPFQRCYNQNELYRLFFYNVSTLYSAPQIGDYIYDPKTTELLEIIEINQTSPHEPNELYACATPIYSEIAGEYKRGTYIKGNSFIPYLSFDWQDVELPALKPLHYAENLYKQAILSGDPDENEAITFNAFNFLPYRLQEYVHETHGKTDDDEIREIWKPVLRSQHNLFKEGDILLYQNHIYEVVKSPYAYPTGQENQEEMQLSYDWQIWALDTIKIGELDVSGIPGPKGDTGPQGPVGPSGADGQDGIIPSYHIYKKRLTGSYKLILIKNNSEVTSFNSFMNDVTNNRSEVNIHLTINQINSIISFQFKDSTISVDSDNITWRTLKFYNITGSINDTAQVQFLEIKSRLGSSDTNFNITTPYDITNITEWQNTQTE